MKATLYKAKEKAVLLHHPQLLIQVDIMRVIVIMRVYMIINQQKNQIRSINLNKIIRVLY